jgi:hypothetical protein
MSFFDKSIINKLDTVLEGLTANSDKNSKLQQHNFNIQLGSTVAVMTFADSSGTITHDTAHDGWNWSNLASGTKINLYFYVGTSDNKTLDDLEELNFSMVNYSSKKPFIVVYTKPTGTDDYEVWYHSKVYYRPSNDFVVGNVHYTYGDDTHLNLDNKPKKPITYSHADGEALATEEILYITLHTSSPEDVGNYSFTLDHFGYKFAGDDMVSIKLSGPENVHLETAVTHLSEISTHSESTDENINFIYQNVLQMSDKLTDISGSNDSLVINSGVHSTILSNIETYTGAANTLLTEISATCVNISTNTENNTTALGNVNLKLSDILTALNTLNTTQQAILDYYNNL